MKLRPYQEAAVSAVKDEFRDGVLSTLLVMPTGSGKTRVMSEVARYVVEKQGLKVLALAHRTELIEQIGDAMQLQGLIPRVEKAEERAAGRFSDVVTASVQTLARPKRLKQFDPAEFGLLLTDEAHHATASTYRTIYEHFKGVPHLGVTATPTRHDGIGLKNVYETVAFQYTLQQAIADGWLVPIKGKQIEVAGIHLEDIKIVAGDFSQSEMDEMLRQEGCLQEMVVPTIELAGDRPTIVFTPGVEHAHEIAACFNRIQPNTAMAVDGGMDQWERAEVMDKFQQGKFQRLVNVNIATEGFDHPPTACIALFRPTRSLGLFAQMVGRGTRLYPEGNKEDCLVLDFVGVNNTVRTITVMDVLDGTILKDAEHEKAQQLQEQGYDTIEALAEAKQFVANLDSVRAKMKAFSTASAFDVLALFATPSCKGLYGGDLATEKQRAYLEGRGVNCPADLEKGEASALIQRFIERQEYGLATFKQMKYIKKLGIADSDIDDLTFAEATAKIDAAVKAKGPRYQYARR